MEVVLAVVGAIVVLAMPMAGPLGVVVPIAAWVAVLVLGFALVYLPTLPRDLARFAREGGQPGCPPHVRLAARALDAALDGLARVLAEFLDMADDDRAAVFRAYAAHHVVAA